MIAPSPLRSGVTGTTRVQVTPWSSEYHGQVPPNSRIRPVLLAVTYTSQQLPPAVVQCHFALPDGSPALL